MLHDRYLLLSLAGLLLGLLLLMAQFGPLHLQDLAEAPHGEELEVLCFLSDYRDSAQGTVARLVDGSGKEIRAFIPREMEPPEQEVLCLARGSLSEDGSMLFIRSMEILERL